MLSGLNLKMNWKLFEWFVSDVLISDTWATCLIITDIKTERNSTAVLHHPTV